MEHSFLIEDAKKYGVECAVLLKNIRFWLDKNIANSKHIKEERVWTYNSAKAFKELFPYLTERQIRIRLEKLEAAGILITGNFNEKNYDNTKWYSVKEEKYNLFPASGQDEETHLPNGNMEVTKPSHGCYQTVRPIPYSNTDSNNIYISPAGKIEETLSEDEFLDIWKRARLHYDKKPTGFKTLSFSEKQGLKDILKDYSKSDIERAIAGLFFQDTLPNVRIRPTHLLDRQYFETYLDCWNNKTKIYSKDKKKKDNTGMI